MKWLQRSGCRELSFRFSCVRLKKCSEASLIKLVKWLTITNPYLVPNPLSLVLAQARARTRVLQTQLLRAYHQHLSEPGSPDCTVPDTLPLAYLAAGVVWRCAVAAAAARFRQIASPDLEPSRLHVRRLPDQQHLNSHEGRRSTAAVVAASIAAQRRQRCQLQEQEVATRIQLLAKQSQVLTRSETREAVQAGAVPVLRHQMDSGHPMVQQGHRLPVVRR